MEQDSRLNLNGTSITTKIPYTEGEKSQNISLMIQVWALLKFCANQKMSRVTTKDLVQFQQVCGTPVDSLWKADYGI